MSDIFLSYTSEDRAVAQRLVSVFLNAGWSVFWDRDIPVGKSWDRVLEAQLPSALVITALWSPRSVTSDWVLIEATEGMEQRKLFPALIQPTPVPLRFKFTHFADLSDWDGSVEHEGCARLLSAIADHLGRPLPAVWPQAPDSRNLERRSQTHDVFLGYARRDEESAQKLVEALAPVGVSVWWDRAIVVGESFDNTILGALEKARAVIILWSERGIASEWVRAEARWAMDRGILINASIDRSPLPVGFSAAPSIDLTQWNRNSQTATVQTLLGLLRQHGVGESALSRQNGTHRATRYAQRDVRRLWLAIAAAALLALLVGIYIGGRLVNGG